MSFIKKFPTIFFVPCGENKTVNAYALEKSDDVAVSEHCKHRGMSWAEADVPAVATYAENSKQNQISCQYCTPVPEHMEKFGRTVASLMNRANYSCAVPELSLNVFLKKSRTGRLFFGPSCCACRAFLMPGNAVVRTDKSPLLSDPPT